MVTLAFDAPAEDEADADAAAELDFDPLDEELVLDLLLEQPATPATTIAAPATATINPRFTTVLLCCFRGPSPDPAQQYRCRPTCGVANGGKNLSVSQPVSPLYGRVNLACVFAGERYVCGMQTLRTPDERYADLPEFPYPPRYSEVDDGDGGSLRVAWVQDGPADADPVLMLHGEPSWSFLYRHMIPVLVAAGHRVVCPDLVGFGRSDKPTRIEDHTYARHVEWMRALVFDVLDLNRVTLVGQDWGGLIGLRLAAENPDRFARLVVANTGLPTGDIPMPEIWWQFRKAIQAAPSIDVGRFVQSGCVRPMGDDVRAAYDAPFPDDSFSAAPRAMPGLVPTSPDDPAAPGNRAAWAALRESATPMLVAFSDSDPITGGMAPIFQREMQGARGYQHPVIQNAGHFLQEDAGQELASRIVAFLATG
jgi:haloalkane dehalogenase